MQADMDVATVQQREQLLKELDGQKKLAKMDAEKYKSRIVELEQKAAHDQQVAEKKIHTLEEDMKKQSQEHARILEEKMRHQDEALDRMLEEQKHEFHRYAVETEQLRRDMMEERMVLDADNPDLMNDKLARNFDRFLHAIGECFPDVPKLHKRSCAVLGPSGVGKSTLINALCGKTVAATGLTECTQLISLVHSGAEWDYYDVPGNHDTRTDWYNTSNLVRLKSLHLIIVVYTNRVQHVINCSRLMAAIGVPVILVRNMCDIADGSEQQWASARVQEMSMMEQKIGHHVPLIHLGWKRIQDANIPGIGRLEQTMSELQAELQDEGRQPHGKKRRMQ